MSDTKKAGAGRFVTAAEAREYAARPPAIGSRIEFGSDRHTDKGPATGEVINVKATVDGYYVTVRFADGQQTFSWDDIRADFCGSRPGVLLIKAMPGRYLRLLERRTDGSPAAMAREDARLSALSADALDWHGHVRQRPDGMRARCGGPRSCPVCQEEQRVHGDELAKGGSVWKKPTPAQAKAGNYYKPRMQWRGLEIAIENPAGTVREGVDETGKAWRTVFKYAYGEFVGTRGMDGDPVDVFVGPDLDAPEVYVVRQMKRKQWDKPDEDKCFIGFQSMEAAQKAYLGHYDDPRFYGSIIGMPADEFVEKVRRADGQMLKSLPMLFFLRR